MENKKILRSLFDLDVIDDNASLAILKTLHENGLFDLVGHFREQIKFADKVTRKACDELIAKITVLRELLPEDNDNDVLAPLINENQTTDEILGRR